MAKESDQAKLLRRAREQLGITSEALADQLGVSLKTLRSWLQPPTTAEGKPAAFYREMPEPAKLLLARILANGKAGKRKR